MKLLAVTFIAVAALGVIAAGAAVLGLTAAAITVACFAAYVLGMGTAMNWLLWAIRGQARHDAQALAMICDPCNGRPGRCVCVSKAECPNPLCGADDTITDGEFSRGLRQLLDREGPT